MADEWESKPGSLCHVEIPAPDLEKAQEFFGEVFGWEFTPLGDTYVLFSTGTVGGGLDSEQPVGDGGAGLVFEVEDIPSKLAQIEAQGGETLTEKTEIAGGHGFFAYFRDPNGNRMGVWSKA